MIRLLNNRFAWAAIATVDTMLFVHRGQPVVATIYLALAVLWIVTGVAKLVDARQ